MALTVRSSGARADVNHAAGTTVPFVALPSSTVILAINQRDTGGAVFGPAHTPAGWTLLVTRYTANDAFAIFWAPGTVTNVGPITQIGGVIYPAAFLELTGADPARATVGSNPSQGWGGDTTAGPVAVPAGALGGPLLAVANLEGTTGDPSPGCYWSDKPGWTKRVCTTHNTSGYHPWWAVYTREYEVAPAEVSDTFANVIGQATQAGLVLFPPVAGAPGVMPRFW